MPPGATIAGHSIRARADMGTSVTRADDQELQGGNQWDLWAGLRCKLLLPAWPVRDLLPFQ